MFKKIANELKRNKWAYVSYGLALVFYLLGMFDNNPNTQDLPAIAACLIAIWGIYEHCNPIESEHQ